jgi:hypothetical protein
VKPAVVDGQAAILGLGEDIDETAASQTTYKRRSRTGAVTSTSAYWSSPYPGGVTRPQR